MPVNCSRLQKELMTIPEGPRTIAYKVVQKAVTSSKFRDFIENEVLAIEENLPQRSREFIVDNASIHKTEVKACLHV